MPRTNIVLDEKLVREAMKLANVTTMREAVDVARRTMTGAKQQLMVLVDTSVWIDFLESRALPASDA